MKIAVVIGALCLLMMPMPSGALDIRMIQVLGNEDVVPVKISPDGDPTQVTFPRPVQHVVQKAKDLSIDWSDSVLYVKALVPKVSERLFVMDSGGGTYILAVETAASAQEATTALVLTRIGDNLDQSERLAESGGATELLRQMIRHQPLAGYRVLDGGGTIFYEGDGFVRLRLLAVYRSTRFTGCIIGVENESDIPVQFGTETIRLPGLLLSYAERERLGPRPRKASEAIHGNHKTLLYIVLAGTGSP